jgi:hypothetical protein
MSTPAPSSPRIGFDSDNVLRTLKVYDRRKEERYFTRGGKNWIAKPESQDAVVTIPTDKIEPKETCVSKIALEIRTRLCMC